MVLESYFRKGRDGDESLETFQVTRILIPRAKPAYRVNLVPAEIHSPIMMAEGGTYSRLAFTRITICIRRRLMETGTTKKQDVLDDAYSNPRSVTA
jgi:hypothetical protein